MLVRWLMLHGSRLSLPMLTSTLAYVMNVEAFSPCICFSGQGSVKRSAGASVFCWSFCALISLEDVSRPDNLLLAE